MGAILMAEQWNRAKRRKMSRYQLGQHEMEKAFTEMNQRTTDRVSRECLSGMMLALVEAFDFPQDQLHRLAVETMKRINGYDCASIMVDRLKKLTGFDVDEPLDEFADVTLMGD
jgi:hypothetical protein